MILAIVTGLAALMILVELVGRARPWPRVAGWWARAIALNTASALWWLLSPDMTRT